MSDKISVGRIVHFYNDALADGFNNGTGKGPYAAIVTQVFDDGKYANLKVLPYGNSWDEGSVSPKEDMGENPSRYWEYPPRVSASHIKMDIKIDTSELRAEIERLQHAMQSGVAAEMSIDDNSVQPKHLRVGVNAAMVEHGALAGILIKKFIMTESEYLESLRDGMKSEVEKYEKFLSELHGIKVKLG